MSWPLIRYVLIAAVRDRLIFTLILILILGSSLSLFMGSSAITEKDRFAIVFAGGGLRMAGVLGLVLFTVFFIRRSFEARDIEFLLSRSVGRVEFLLSYSMGLSILAFFMGVAQGLCLFILGSHLFGPGSIDWVVSITIENIIMVNTALFFSMILSSSANAAMSSAGFYLLGRLMGQLLGIIDAHETTSPVFRVMESMMQIISALMPRLDLLGQTSWLIYGAGNNLHLSLILIHGLIFCVFILAAAIIDLVRRQF